MNCLRTLIVFYADSEDMRNVVLDLADDLRADLMEITCPSGNNSVGFKLRSYLTALLDIPAKTNPFPVEPCLYDLVIIGTPIHSLSMSSPIRSFIRRTWDRLPNVAFFAVHSGSGFSRTMRQMSILSSQIPLAILSINKRKDTDQRYLESLCSFELRLQRRMHQLRTVAVDSLAPL